MVRDEQVRKLRQKMANGMTQEAAAAATGMSVRTARTWQQGPLPTEARKARDWRTRPDPFEGVWTLHLLPLLEADTARCLEATTLLAVLQERVPGQFGPHHLRTLQRRLRDWRALHGPDREVMFAQVHPPGREAAIDFTHATELGVTIAGVLLVHLLFEFVLTASGWTWVALAFGETFEALVAGLQGALWSLQGVPEVIRSDNLSAATHELRHTGGRALNTRFKAVLEHYGLRSTRIKPGQSHENGAVEQSHRRVKSDVAQALVVRGSKDFATLEEYELFVRGVVARTRNTGIDEALALERQHLKPLPSAPVPNWTSVQAVVRQWSTLELGKRTYSVPSRLIGHAVEARLHPDTIEVYYRGRLTATMPRLHGTASARIDYRHVIWSLVRKPGAFARYRYREELFPSLTFRRGYDALRRFHGDRADVEYVRTLHLAASTFEATVEQALVTLLASERPFDYAAIKALAAPAPCEVPVVTLTPPDLSIYDALLTGAGR